MLCSFLVLIIDSRENYLKITGVKLNRPLRFLSVDTEK